MGKMRKSYPPEFRQQIVEVVRAGRTPESLAREFEPTAKSLRNWVKQADHDDTASCSPRLRGSPPVRPVIAFSRSRRAAHFLVSRSLPAVAADSCLSLRKSSTFDVDSCTLLSDSRVRVSCRLSPGRPGRKRSMSSVAPSATLASNRFPVNVHVPHARLHRYPANRPARGGRAGCCMGVLAQHGGVVSSRGAIRLSRSCQKAGARSFGARMSARLNPYPAATSAAISSLLPGQRPKKPDTASEARMRSTAYI